MRRDHCTLFFVSEEHGRIASSFELGCISSSTNLRLQLDETETYQKERYLTIVEPDNEEDADLYESNYIEKITDDILKKLTINGQIKSI